MMRDRGRAWLRCGALLLAAWAPLAAQEGRVVVGAKNFTESAVLAELMA